MRISRHDLKPDLQATCYDGDTPVDLTTALAIKVNAQRDGAPAFSRTATGDAEGRVTMPWQPGDTDTTGILKVEVEVTWPGGGGKPQTFPIDDVVQIDPDLG